MKKAVALLLGLMLVVSFAVVACGGSDVTDWTEAVEYEGEEATITGTVMAVSDLYEEKGIGKVLVRLGGDATEEHFNVTFVLDPETGEWPEYASDWESTVDTLIGKTVEVTGIVTLNEFEAAYEVLMNDADDNTVPDDQMNATLVVK